jgi:hypothetical protein
MTAVKELLGLKREYEDACEQWQTILEMLRKVSEVHETFPKHEKADDHCVIYQFTDTKLFCSFSFKNRNAVLTYGYVDQDEYRRTKYVPTSQQSIDKAGNIKNTTDATASGNIENLRDYVSFFFQQILNAQKKAWEKMMPE